MKQPKTIRYLIIALFLLLGVYWITVSASPAIPDGYPNNEFLITAPELKKTLGTEMYVVVDVRDDEHFDGKMIPGAIRLPWSLFRRESVSDNMEGLFVGIEEAQKILGGHGLFRNDTIVLYDSVERDGGATASYVFWVLDLLGHKKKMLLDRGIDGWRDAGGMLVNEIVEREPLLYQAPKAEIVKRRWADEDFIYPRLGDPYYQIIDVRSEEEYTGEKLNPALDGTPLKAGHIPGAYNLNYKLNWTDTESKSIKDYKDLLQLYSGIDPTKAVIVYCHSARRSSFSYFILRLMGFEDVIVYDNSWFGWGNPNRFYPVESSPNTLKESQKPKVNRKVKSADGSQTGQALEPAATNPKRSQNDKGYISCGG